MDGKRPLVNVDDLQEVLERPEALRPDWELLEQFADELNQEAEDVLGYQNVAVFQPRRGDSV